MDIEDYGEVLKEAAKESDARAIRSRTADEMIEDWNRRQPKQLEPARFPLVMTIDEQGNKVDLLQPSTPRPIKIVCIHCRRELTNPICDCWGKELDEDGIEQDSNFNGSAS